jgi:hypothetical protein
MGSDIINKLEYIYIMNSLDELDSNESNDHKKTAADLRSSTARKSLVKKNTKMNE